MGHCLVSVAFYLREAELLQQVICSGMAYRKRLVQNTRAADLRGVVCLRGVDAVQAQLGAAGPVDASVHAGTFEGPLGRGVEADRVTVRSGADDPKLTLDQLERHPVSTLLLQPLQTYRNSAQPVIATPPTRTCCKHLKSRSP